MTAAASPIDSAAPLPVSTLAGAHVPASVRENAPGARQAYKTAQSFEEMLLNQLSQSLMQSSGLTGEGEGEGATGEGGAGAGEAQGAGGGASGMVASLLPQTLTEGVMRAGGLGLAGQLMNAVDPQLGAASAAPASVGGGAEAAPAVGGPGSSALPIGNVPSAAGSAPSAPVSAGGGTAYSPAGSLDATGGASA